MTDREALAEMQSRGYMTLPYHTVSEILVYGVEALSLEGKDNERWIVPVSHLKGQIVGQLYVPCWALAVERAMPRLDPLRAPAYWRGARDPDFAAAIETVYRLGRGDPGLAIVEVAKFIEMVAEETAAYLAGISSYGSPLWQAP